MTMCDDFRSIAQRILKSKHSPYTASVLRVLLGLKFSHDTFQLPLSLALREVAHLVVLWSDFHQPFGLYISAGADVVLGGQHKLVVKHPLGLVVQNGGRVQLDHLVVLHCEIVAGALQVSNLHEEAGDQSAADVDVIVSAGELCAASG